jgi:hypothetical protein
VTSQVNASPDGCDKQILHAIERPSSTMRSRLKKFAMRSFEPIALVAPHFAGCGHPVDSLVRIVVEEKLAFARDAPGNFERNAVYVNEINSRWQLKLPWQRRIVRLPSANIQIGRRPRSAPTMAAKHQRKLART